MHLNGIALHPERFAVVAAVDPDEQNLAETSGKYDIARRYMKLDDLLADGDIDVAVVCTPTHVRLDVVKPLVDAGVPVFCEKPLAETFDEAKAIAAAAEAAGVPVAVDQNFRKCFSFHLAKEVLASGEIGRPLQWIQSAAGLRRDQGWRNTRGRYVMAIMTIHWLDGYRYLFDEEPSRIYCRGVNSPAVEGGPDTGVSLVVEFPSGVLVNLSESFSSFGGANRASLDCERGALVLDYQTLTVIDGDKNERQIANPFSFKESAAHWLLDLCDAAEQGRQPETSVQDNLNTMRMLEAAYRSLEIGQPVEVASVQ